MINFEQRLIARAAARSAGDPHRQLANDARIVYRTRAVRVLVDGWYGNGRPVKVGEELRMLEPDALGAVHLGRAEFVV